MNTNAQFNPTSASKAIHRASPYASPAAPKERTGGQVRTQMHDQAVEVVKLDSSAIASVCYDAKRRVLGIAFKSGHSYSYFAVGREVFEGLIMAESAGSYYHKFIRDIYESEKVEA